MRLITTTRRAAPAWQHQVDLAGSVLLLIYTAEPGSPSAERLRLLASWAASEQATVQIDHP